MGDSGARSTPPSKREDQRLVVKGRSPISLENLESEHAFDLFPSEVCDAPEPLPVTSTWFPSEVCHAPESPDSLHGLIPDKPLHGLTPVTSTLFEIVIEPPPPQTSQQFRAGPSVHSATGKSRLRGVIQAAAILVLLFGLPLASYQGSGALGDSRRTVPMAALASAVPQLSPGERVPTREERDNAAIRAVLNRYREALWTKNAAAMRAVFPAARPDLLRAEFATRAGQMVATDRCLVRLTGRTATAACASATIVTMTPDAGPPRSDGRRWQFRLRSVGNRWRITSVTAAG